MTTTRPTLFPFDAFLSIVRIERARFGPIPKPFDEISTERNDISTGKFLVNKRVFECSYVINCFSECRNCVQRKGI